MSKKVSGSMKASSIVKLLKDLCNDDNAIGIMVVARNGALFDFNQCLFFDVSEWDEDDMDTLEYSTNDTRRAKVQNMIRKYHDEQA